MEDGELGRAAARVEAHVARCAACRARLAEMQSLSAGFATAVAVVDPAGEEALARLAREGAPRPVSSTRRPWLRAALIAGVLFGSTAVAGVAALWVRDRLAASPTPAVEETAPRAARGSGLSIPAPAGGVRIELAGLGPASRIEIALVDGDSVSLDVQAEAPVRYGERTGTLTATTEGRAEVIVAIPRAAEATLTVDGTVRAVVRNGVLDLPSVESGVTIVSREPAR